MRRVGEDRQIVHSLIIHKSDRTIYLIQKNNLSETGCFTSLDSPTPDQHKWPVCESDDLAATFNGSAMPDRNF